MPIKKINCHCKKKKRNPYCQAPFHSEIIIISCEKNCGLGCHDDN